MPTDPVRPDATPAYAPTLQEDDDSRTVRRRRRQQARERSRRIGLAMLAAAALLGALTLGLYAMRQQARGKAPAAVGAASPAGSAASGAVATAPGAVKPLSQDQLSRTVEQAAEQVKREPANASAWAMLAHSQAMLGDFPAAKGSYARLAELLPQDAQVLADWADAAAVAQGRKLAGEPAQLIARALKLDPKNLKALMLAGREAFERKKYGEAITLWERARAVAAATDGGLAGEIDANIAEARAFDGRERPPAAVAQRPGGAVVAGRVTLAPELAGKVQPDDTVFVFARPLQGSRMPVALLRRKVRDLPLEFKLDDSMAMVPDIKLSMLAKVAVGARISRRGDATPHAGDLQGLVEPVALGTRDVQVRVSEVIP